MYICEYDNPHVGKKKVVYLYLYGSYVLIKYNDKVNRF